jgi:hypothetical protein
VSNRNGHEQRLKPAPFCVFSARLKPCPDTNRCGRSFRPGLYCTVKLVPAPAMELAPVMVVPDCT